jgi:predicted Rossmann-fold nucleotide-binding protein
MWVDGKDELHRGIASEDVVIVEGETLSDRKAMLIEGCDCVISMPGGVGTMDELFEVIAERQLGMNPRSVKSLVLINPTR